jgi:hypothetical protein
MEDTIEPSVLATILTYLSNLEVLDYCGDIRKLGSYVVVLKDSAKRGTTTLQEITFYDTSFIPKNAMKHYLSISCAYEESMT